MKKRCKSANHKTGGEGPTAAQLEDLGRRLKETRRALSKYVRAIFDAEAHELALVCTSADEFRKELHELRFRVMASTRTDMPRLLPQDFPERVILLDKAVLDSIEGMFDAVLSLAIRDWCRKFGAGER
jgi:hypothetical protein